MINEQIILWIVKNSQVYFSNSSAVDLSFFSQSRIHQHYSSIIEIIKRQIPSFLRQHGSVTLEGFISFRIIKSKQPRKNCLQYQIEYPLNLQAAKNKEHYKTKAELDELFLKRVSSLLSIEKEQIKQFIKIFGKSINDLIISGATLKINLDFCLLKMRKNQISCKFSKKIIESIQQQQENLPPNRIKLNLCHSKCLNANEQNITTKTSSIYSLKQAEVKDGNLFNHPSLLEIKNLYDKGRQLELKYKHLFD